VLLGPRVSAMPCCLTLPHPAAAHRAPTVARPHLSADAPASLGPLRPPLSRGNSTARARCSGPDAGHPSHPPPHLGPLFFSVPDLHAAPTPGPPCLPLFPSAVRLSAFKAVGCHPITLSALLLLTHAQAHRLPRPPLTRSTSLGCQDRRSPPRIPR
jgi:hypothetical protein